MGRVTIALTAISTGMLLVTFGKGMSILRGGDVGSHLYWAIATLLSVLAANLIAMVHAAQSDRIIRELRSALERQTAAAGEASSRGPV